MSKKQPVVNNEQLDSLNNELTRLAIDRSESEARLKHLQSASDDLADRIARRARLDQEIKQTEEALKEQNTKRAEVVKRIDDLNSAKAAFRPIDLSKDGG